MSSLDKAYHAEFCACHTKFTLRDTRDAANEFFRKKSLKPSAEEFACEKIMLELDLLFSDPHDRKEFFALEDVKALAYELQMLDEDKKWEIVRKCGWRFCHMEQFIAAQ
ncbi:hypothetical protein WN943_023757 [Citrus x changshan-huyou]